MGFFDGTFQADAEHAAKSYVPLPIGNYNLKVVSSILRPWKSAKGEHLVLEFEVEDGEHKGKTLKNQSITSKADNDVAKRIGDEQFCAFCLICGLNPERFKSVDDLLGAKGAFRVTQKDEGEYGIKNEVVFRLGGTEAPMTAAKSAATKPGAKSAVDEAPF